MGKINVELKKIPDTDENAIEFEIKKWVHENRNGETEKRTITIDLIFRDDAYLQLSLNKQCPYQGTWSGDSINNPVTATIRLFASKLPEAFDFFAKEIDKRNMENDIAINTIAGLMEKMK